jgi:hypothetical protein
MLAKQWNLTLPLSKKFSGLLSAALNVQNVGKAMNFNLTIEKRFRTIYSDYNHCISGLYFIHSGLFCCIFPNIWFLELWTYFIKNIYSGLFGTFFTSILYIWPVIKDLWTASYFSLFFQLFLKNDPCLN